MLNNLKQSCSSERHSKFYEGNALKISSLLHKLSNNVSTVKPLLDSLMGFVNADRILDSLSHLHKLTMTQDTLNALLKEGLLLQLFLFVGNKELKAQALNAIQFIMKEALKFQTSKELLPHVVYQIYPLHSKLYSEVFEEVGKDPEIFTFLKTSFTRQLTLGQKDVAQPLLSLLEAILPKSAIEEHLQVNFLSQQCKKEPEPAQVVAFLTLFKFYFQLYEPVCSESFIEPFSQYMMACMSAENKEVKSLTMELMEVLYKSEQMKIPAYFSKNIVQNVSTLTKKCNELEHQVHALQDQMARVLVELKITSPNLNLPPQLNKVTSNVKLLQQSQN